MIAGSAVRSPASPLACKSDQRTIFQTPNMRRSSVAISFTRTETSHASEKQNSSRDKLTWQRKKSVHLGLLFKTHRLLLDALYDLHPGVRRLSAHDRSFGKFVAGPPFVSQFGYRAHGCMLYETQRVLDDGEGHACCSMVVATAAARCEARVASPVANISFWRASSSSYCSFCACSVSSFRSAI